MTPGNSSAALHQSKTETYLRVFALVERAAYPNSVPVAIDPNVVKATREIFRVLGLGAEPAVPREDTRR